MIRVLVTACTSGPLLEAQAAALKRHMQGEYELTVVNDAKDEEHFSNMWAEGKAEEIEAAAAMVGARHVRFPQAWHTDRKQVFPDEPDEWADVENANTRCADAIQYGVDLLLGESGDPLLILDADMVPYDAFDPHVFLDTAPLWGVAQTRGGITYLWNGLILVNPKRVTAMNLFNLDCRYVYGVPCDVGGMLYRFLRANWNQFGRFAICSAGEHVALHHDPDMPERLIDFFKWDVETQRNHRISETYGDCFAHLGGGGNWEVREQDEALERVRRFVEAVA